MIKQTTIKNPVTVSGVGLHTGALVNLTFKPAPANHGFKFKRIDLDGQPVIDADVDNVVDTSRGTTLSQNGAKISTTEHALAALVGTEIDNIMIEVDGPEVPIMDGSSRPYIDAILKAGIEEQNAERIYFELKDNLTFEEPSRKVEMLAVPSADYRITVMVDYNSPVLGTQHAQMHLISEFQDEIAPCRTFCFLHELEMLVKHNLIKGGDLDNAIVVVDRPVSQQKLDELATLFNKPQVEIKEKGILNNVQLHFQNEPARHKLLDIVGDLALIGMPIKAHILAARPGHAANVEFAKKIKQLIKNEKSKTTVPVFDLYGTPVCDINKIAKNLPHRYPFLLIDKIIELTDNRVVGVKNVTMNEWFFQGHFPDNPVMPGVLMIEAMAQTGGILVLHSVPDPENYWTYFLRIDQARFKQKVGPGDTLVFDLELISPIRRGICHMAGKAYVGDKIVMEAEMMAQIVKKS
ncbi:MAG: bifunctional UDP-3-O-[3-hydroxymyristoyl] N-acetylglucosamine deacetylase/3-hydroxyacyl-ACP dehydratase [Bacteroidia bacterium]|nr:bifunctional UDP-3-O-[3-hydroxymyristoyl] N-acetylglucosamine deacetylase/3-hydroxyacyl-ACP dehydratase [Bacteroidota bacterium]MBK8876509.1 bifunctional UDP-3-O-[3-hydroxymyristoyl] N-acetylglucosamine deacetylase/3-hydroxyacyl-ACP dehydratase [Bacteroidota bacterium]MBK9424688.1 bifunctional UDP-3-O-[3-hydroxymyristoyl] N-acetylglucosamine deacetylase/3-hydroxyacyl-ACP dehydratase [Bacteroidota bacterium]MBP9081768.1 bifunctional UDP-3-O-[3-hydroxymyristoyl] N-acetylglucosamine deacetylase/